MQLPLFYLVWISLIQSTISYPLVIDLTHTITPNIPYFPSQTRFNFTQIFAGWVKDEKPFFYSTNAFTTSEHMGTHLDAPYHFYTEGWKVDEIPLERLIAVPTRIIDVSKQCKNNRNYLITIEDLQKSNLKFPSRQSETPKKFYFILLFYTGWSEFWPNQRLYAGPDDSDLQFPGLSEELTEYLISEYGANLVGVGIDTLSTDYGRSKNFPVHQILAKNNKYGLENVAAMDKVLAHVHREFFSLDIHPMKIGNGTGAPCRLLAHLDHLAPTLHTDM